PDVVPRADELVGELLEQLRMGRFPARREAVQGMDQSSAEQQAPVAVDGGACELAVGGQQARERGATRLVLADALAGRLVPRTDALLRRARGLSGLRLVGFLCGLLGAGEARLAARGVVDDPAALGLAPAASADFGPGLP